MNAQKSSEPGERVSNMPFRPPQETASWWATVPLNPFRLFFPLGILFGVTGVGHWLLWSMGWRAPNIALVHAALQTQGFLVCFVVGFLMTAFPRFTGTWPANKTEIAVMLTAALSIFVSTLEQWWVVEQVSFLILVVNLIVFAGRRVPHRHKDLPPSFLLMGFGFLQAILGPVLILTSGFGMSNYALFSVGRQMIQVGFLLCMVLGVTGKLAPFLLGYTDDPESDTESRTSFRKGNTAIFLHGLTGAGLLASFFIDAVSPRIGAGLRAVLVTLHLFSFARIGRPLKKKTTLMFFFYVSCWMVSLGLWAAFFWPQYRIAALHIIFLGGFSLMIFSFGLLIVLSHSAKAALLNTRLISMRVVGGFVLTAMIFRFIAEMISSQYVVLIHIASGLWVLAALLWAAMTIPKIIHGANPGHPGDPQ
jgi:uncharacterized protein involved in response to NO